MIGITPYREQGYKDPLLVEVMKAHGIDSLPHYDAETPEKKANKAQIRAWGEVRDGPALCAPDPVGDALAFTQTVKGMARDLGADGVGVAALQPLFVNDGVDLPHDTVLCLIVHENYHKVNEGPDAVEAEASRVYRECARLSHEMAIEIRKLGYPARAHHNGGCDIQAIPALYHAGFGELGKHGSLINPEFGANFRPGFVTTTAPLVSDTPHEFGVQDYCQTCQLCHNNCPGEAIPDEYVMTEGIRRWLTDVAKCYPYSRLREEYCHICVDVCPYIHKENGNTDYRAAYKDYMKARKSAGYRSAKTSG